MVQVSKSIVISICNPKDSNKPNFVKEDKKTDNQSYDGDACRPARNWIMNELKKHYKFVYCVKTQPNNIEFPLNWPIESHKANSSIGHNTRSLFVGSQIELGNNKLLSSNLINKYASGNKFRDYYFDLKRMAKEKLQMK